MKLYLKSLAYATEHGEKELLAKSFVEMQECQKATEKSIIANYTQNIIRSKDVVDEIADKFGAEKLLFLLALSAQKNDSDIRISRNNHNWAAAYLAGLSPDANDYFIYRALTLDKVHSGLLNLIINAAREAYTS